MKKLIFILFIFYSSLSFAAKEEELFHIYGGLGEIYGQSSIRFGGKTWEAGLLNRRSIGVAFLEYSDDMYLAFGPMIGLEFSPGAFVGIGWEWTFFGFTSLRLEANSGHSLDNYSSSEVNIGFSLYW